MRSESCDIFCNVIDNYGDIGVCWRLARQLANEHGLAVRLWVDDLASFARLCPEADAALEMQRCRGVEVRRWSNVPFRTCSACRSGDRGFRLQVAAELHRGDGGARAKTGVGEPRISFCRRLGRELPQAAFAAPDPASDQVFLLPRLHRGRLAACCWSATCWCGAMHSRAITRCSRRSGGPLDWKCQVRKP